MDIENKYGLKEFQQKLLILMTTVDELCADNDINYCADSGTLLGAVRHNGFIPWDDDLDIVLSRSDYEKLKKVNLSKYGIDLKRNSFIESLCLKDSVHFSKIVACDLFVLDNIPDIFLLGKLKLFLIMIVHGLWHHGETNYKANSFFKKCYSKILGFVGGFYTDEEIFYLFQRIQRLGNKSVSQRVKCYNYLTKELHVEYPNDILEHIERHKFETIEINVPKKYDVYLSNLYGSDYMTPIKTK